MNKDVIKMALVLTIVTSIAAASLAKIYDITKGPIAEAKRQEILRAIKTVLPETIRGRVEIRAGDAGEEILKVAQDFGIDLIAFPLSAARPGGPWPMVSNVISRVCCPVVILPPRLVGH